MDITKRLSKMKRTILCCILGLMAQISIAQTAKEKQIAEWERAKVYTLEYLDAMPEDGYGFKPVADIRSFAEQMDHLADATFAFAAAASGKKSPMEGSAEKMADQSKSAVTKVVMSSYDFTIDAIKSMSDEDFAKDVALFGMTVNAGTALEKSFEHQTHHRGQTTVYLRLKGIAPPKERLF
jgi:uncharacterized damage-inducible protein DinB